MTIILRDYQQDVERQTIAHLTAPQLTNVIDVMPCGSGKTVLFSKITNDFDGAVSLIVHRQELVAQISLTLASFGIVHDIISPKNVISNIIRQHVKRFGRSFYSSRSHKKVGGVDTIIRRKDHDFDKWRKTVGLWIQDECHHVLRENKWGKAAELFPIARGLGVTATPERADGKGLGRHADGLFDTMVEGPSLRWMIDQGYLVDYKIYAPPSDVNYEGLKVGASGDYTAKALREREKNSHIFGDVVDHFLRIAGDKQGITFASNIKSAIDITAQFNNAGVIAKLMTGESSDGERFKTDKLFREGKIKQMPNVDLFGEGYDIPILDCVSMARKTQSFPLFVQQATRMLRPSYAEDMPLDTREQRLAAIAASQKQYGILIDHVGNVERHAVYVNGVIDLCYRQWLLDRKERRSSSKTDDDSIPVKNCTNPMCAATYEAIHPACPFCGEAPKKTERKTPEQVEGDLIELDPKSLRQIKIEVERVTEPYKPKGLTQHTAANMRRHESRRQAITGLRDAIALWAGRYRAQGESDQVICRRFYHTFGVDLLSCQTSSRNDANALRERIEKCLV